MSWRAFSWRAPARTNDEIVFVDRRDVRKPGARIPVATLLVTKPEEDETCKDKDEGQDASDYDPNKLASGKMASGGYGRCW